MNKQQLIKKINQHKTRSAWTGGVQKYALDLISDSEYEEFNPETIEEALFNGASDWKQFSYSGSSLIYDYDIAERLCNPSELKRCKGGEKNPNCHESWLDCQARALFQAYMLIKHILRS